MKILHLLSQVELTGAEVYAYTLSEWQRSQGHQVFIVSEQFHCEFTGICISKPLHSASRFKRLSLIAWLREYIKKNEIDVVHAHSRAAVRVGYWATRALKKPLVTSVHGEQHFSLSKKFFNNYGEKIITVSGGIKTQLIRDFGYHSDSIQVIPNPVVSVDPSLVEDLPKDIRKNFRIVYVTRGSGPKGQKCLQFLNEVLPFVLKKYSQTEFVLAGIDSRKKNDFSPDIVSQISILAKDFPKRVTFLPSPVKSISPSFYSVYDLTIGGGRVGVEACMAGIPLFAIGEASTIGLVTEEKWSDLVDSNFGDIGCNQNRSPDLKELFNAAIETLLGADPVQLKMAQEAVQQRAVEVYSIDRVGKEIMDAYGWARLKAWHSSWIPVLMYHKVPKAPLNSKHRIFVTEDNLERHFKFFKKNNFQTLTFQNILDFKNGARPLDEFPRRPLVLTFDDGYVDNLTTVGPLLEKYGLQAVIYLLADHTVLRNSWDDDGEEPLADLMTLDQKKQLLRFPFEIGSHGFRHDKLSQIPSHEWSNEITKSKAKLEFDLGVTVHSYAYTYGDHPPGAEKVVSTAGYGAAVNTDSGGLTMGDSPFSIFRVNVFPEDQEWQLKKKTASWYRKYFFKKKGR